MKDVRTTKPISTISYNTPAFLRQKLEELTKAKVLEFWAFIEHEPEPDEKNDEAGPKKHIHVFAIPAKMLQTVDLEDEFKEIDPTNPRKPLGVISFHSSKFPDWYLYGLHDRRYLLSKKQKRKFHYKAEMVQSSNPDELRYKVKTIDLLELSAYDDMIDAQKQGLSWSEYFKRGTVPIPQIRNFKEAWFTMLSQSEVERNGHENHPSTMPEKVVINGKIVDPETGEVITSLEQLPEETLQKEGAKS